MLFLLNIFYPNRCLTCDTITQYNKLLCDKCKKDVTIRLPKSCYTKIDNLTVYAVFPYYDHPRIALLQFKYGKNLNKCYKYAMFMSMMLKENNIHNKIDLITYVPKYHKEKYKFNSAYELAKRVSQILNIPISNKILIKNKKTQKQHDLKKEFRETNLLNSFECRDINLIKNKTILIIDDVCTTGNTLNICSKTLLQYGAKKSICCTATINL